MRLSPITGVIERLAGAIHPDAASGEIPDLPIREKNHFHHGQPHDLEPDFIIRLAGDGTRHLID